MPLRRLALSLHRAKSVVCGGAASAPSEGFGFRAPPLRGDKGLRERKAFRSHFCNSVACGGAASAPSEEGAGAPKGYKGATEGERTRGRCLLRGAGEHRVKKRSFAFALVYIKCFRTYSVYLSLRLPAQIPYAGIHLCPLAVLRSCFGYSLSHLRTAAACLSRCIRHRRRSKAKPLRGSRGGYRRKPQI